MPENSSLPPAFQELPYSVRMVDFPASHNYFPGRGKRLAYGLAYAVVQLWPGVLAIGGTWALWQAGIATDWKVLSALAAFVACMWAFGKGNEALGDAILFARSDFFPAFVVRAAENVRRRSQPLQAAMQTLFIGRMSMVGSEHEKFTGTLAKAGWIEDGEWLEAIVIPGPSCSSTGRFNLIWVCYVEGELFAADYIAPPFMRKLRPPEAVRQWFVAAATTTDVPADFIDFLRSVEPEPHPTIMQRELHAAAKANTASAEKADRV